MRGRVLLKMYLERHLVWESGLEGLDWNDLALNRIWRRVLMSTVMDFQVLRWEVTWQVDPHEGFCCTVPFMNKGKVQLCTNVCVLVRIISVRFGIEVLDLNQLVLYFFLCLQIVLWNMWQYSIQNFCGSFLSTWVSYWNLHFFFVSSLFMAGMYGDWTVKIG